jgi:hypothetical protein
MSHRTKGGRQRCKPKDNVLSVCPICHQQVTKRQSRSVERDGDHVRICKKHPCPKSVQHGPSYNTHPRTTQDG